MMATTSKVERLRTKILLIVMLLMYKCDCVRSYPNGAGSKACDTQNPAEFHGGAPQNTTSPFAVIVSDKTYSPGQLISVTLRANKNTTFKGFLLGAHPLHGNTTQYLGTFRVDVTNNATVQPRCGEKENSGLTHTNPDPKPTLTVLWTASDVSNQTDIFFKAAFVGKDSQTYWVNITSGVLKFVDQPPSTTLTQSSEATTTLTTTLVPSTSTGGSDISNFPRDSTCGISESCFGDCTVDKPQCTFLTSWKVSEQTALLITIKSIFHQENNVWMAIGFGTTSTMNPASVSECVAYKNSFNVFMSYNTAYDNTRINQEISGLSLVSGSLENDLFTCTFKRQLVIPGNDQIYNLTRPYHILLARGQANGWEKQPHSSGDAFVTPDSKNLTEFTDSHVTLQINPLIQLHGCLMTLAWVFSGSIGLLLARFYKNTWSTKTLWGVKVWFAIHRLAMIVTFLATSVGFIVIFVEIQGMSHLDNASLYQQAHPIMGIVIMTLTVINPLMSLFRCAPNDKYRPIFNWAHWAVGSSAYILGIIAVGIGTTMRDSALPSFTTYVIIAFGVWHVLVHLLLEGIKYLESKAAGADDYKELQSMTSTAQLDQRETIRHVAIVLHVIVAALTFLIIMITIANL